MKQAFYFLIEIFPDIGISGGLIWIIAVFLVAGCDSKERGTGKMATKIISLENWEFRQADSDAWRTASIPGNVHMDLLAHPQIQVGSQTAKARGPRAPGCGGLNRVKDLLVACLPPCC